jgi:site-specific recombinase XerD
MGMSTVADPARPLGAEHVDGAPEHALEGLALDFLAYLEFERGLSRNTLEAYRTDLLQFGRFLDARGVGPLDAQASDVADFLAWLARGAAGGRPASPATVHRKAACLRSFYRHLRARDCSTATRRRRSRLRAAAAGCPRC